MPPLSNVIYTRIVEDQTGRDTADPGGHSGMTLRSSVTDLTPDVGSSGKPLPGPATIHLSPASQGCLDTKGAK